MKKVVLFALAISVFSNLSYADSKESAAKTALQSAVSEAYQNFHDLIHHDANDIQADLNQGFKDCVSNPASASTVVFVQRSAEQNCLYWLDQELNRIGTEVVSPLDQISFNLVILGADEAMY